jgi:hypothetical protein
LIARWVGAVPDSQGLGLAFWNAARRFVAELDQAEDRLQAERKHTADLERQNPKQETSLPNSSPL